MRRPLLLAAALLAAAPAVPQARSTDLPRLMTLRSVMSLPAARPDFVIGYGDAPAQQVELFLPRPDPERPDARRPVVVMIHGGCWQKDLGGPPLMRAAAAALTEKGHAVWSIGYRRVDEEGGGHPGTYADVARALDLIRDEAERHRLDPGRVAIFGHSAGAHLALWAAGRHRLAKDSPLHAADPLRPRGVVAAGGFGNLADWEGEISQACGEGIVSRLVPEGVEGTRRFAEVSPHALLPTGVPVLMLHGVFDEVAFPAMGLAFARDARRAGDRADVEVAPVAGHFEPIAPGTGAFSQVLAALERFLR